MTFFGHALPASFFFAFSTFVLCLTLHRARKLPPNSSFTTLAQSSIPEPNTSILHKCGILATISSLLGFAYESIGGYTHHHGNWLYHIVHLALYLSFTFVGIVLWLESYHRLPPDSHRMALALAFLLEYVLWTEHANMKTDGPKMIHLLMGQTCLVSSLTFCYSIQNPTSILAYIIGWSTMVLQSTWLFAAGVSDIPGYEMEMHKIGSYFCLHVLGIAFVIVVASACVGNKGEEYVSVDCSDKEEVEPLDNSLVTTRNGRSNSRTTTTTTKEFEKFEITDSVEEEEQSEATFV